MGEEALPSGGTGMGYGATTDGATCRFHLFLVPYPISHIPLAGTSMVYSDGSQKIRFMNPATGK